MPILWAFKILKNTKNGYLELFRLKTAFLAI